jgi:hypothetical protein
MNPRTSGGVESYRKYAADLAARQAKVFDQQGNGEFRQDSNPWCFLPFYTNHRMRFFETKCNREKDDFWKKNLYSAFLPVIFS